MYSQLKEKKKNEKLPVRVLPALDEKKKIINNNEKKILSSLADYLFVCSTSKAKSFI